MYRSYDTSVLSLKCFDRNWSTISGETVLVSWQKCDCGLLFLGVRGWRKQKNLKCFLLLCQHDEMALSLDLLAHSARTVQIYICRSGMIPESVSPNA